MSNILSRQYCAYRYKWEKKDWVKTMLIFPPVILGVLLFICSIFKPGFALVLIIEVEKRKLVAGVVLFWLLFIVLYSIHKRKKCKKFREAVRDNRPCESCKVTFVFDKEHRYIRSDGQERIESMGWDEDAKLKSGQDAVVVYIPFMDEFYTEMPETLKKVEKSIKN